ncbi:TonB-dependent receptor [Algoriphagus sp.]|jgi:TonB-linked SusC/RagA family outer membrane protein|uniref:SusC/RagA family TonB-linked outer membrane protein n=1 Tax=Algoriphagus sp. TaxID=1872435 RepID=UPI002724C868|nr:TonB-dependent receptor [Algoriphagus sp.]MDO8965430.1 TonB-dependent receptor [Algoriphagus sp.]MDP3201469.1 TonB-dependent receptor [Algoriphagus sp.]
MKLIKVKETVPLRRFGRFLSQKKMLLLGLLYIQTIAFAWAWQTTASISGKVISPDGEALPGVVVLEKGTSNGQVTDLDGNFSIRVASQESILVFSLVGFNSQEIQVGNQSIINLTLRESESLLQEVVVVGYGEQKKLNLTGSVETVRFDDAVNQPVTNSAQLMYGKFSGVQLTQSSGLPGADGSAIVIRGIGTFGGTNPLVVIDNIQYTGLAEFNNLAPSDIESISVLKDASASAIYGARGANGVLVVTTKKGTKGKFSVDYNNYYGVQRVTVVPEYLDAVNYALLRNERDRNVNGPNAPLRFSEANIEAIRNGTDPDQFANTNWAKVALRDAPIQNHYLSFTGGSDQVTYRVSLGYLNQEAVVNGKFKSDRYNLGLNLTLKPNKWLTVTNVTNGFWSRFVGPNGGANAITGETGIINQFQRSSPLVPVYYSNGELGVVDGAYENVNFSYPINNVLLTGNFGDYSSDNINLSERIGLSAKIADGLFFETSGSAIINFDNISNFRPTLTTRDWAGNVVQQNVLNSLSNTLDFNYRLLNENILRYSTRIKEKHNLSVIVGHSVIYDKVDGFSGSLQSFPSDAIQEFNGGGVLNPSVSGGASEEAWQSFFARVNYNYKEKYLFEANIRKDGSSKFGRDNRYGTFPSVSAGWNIAREEFLSGSRTITDLKIRGSWGISGNDRIGNYIFEQTYNTGLDYHVGQDVILSAVALTSLANPFITWESIEQFNIGLDASFFNNKVNLTADYFKRISSDILYTNFPIPNSIGVTNLAAVNAAGMENAGLELSLGYRENIGKLVMNFSGNVTRMADNRVTSLGPNGIETIGGNTIIRIGVPFNSYFGYQAQGIFQTQEEVDSAPRQFGSNLTRPGDMRYADLSGPDGIPDGVINAFDRTVIGNPFPRWIYGMNANFQFSGFDLNMVFQGVGKLDRLLFSNGQTPMEGDRNNSLSYWVDRWTPENPSQTLPRLGGINNSVTSTFYIQDMSYLRLRNLEFGYTIPVTASQKVLLQKARVFVSGQNLLTFTKVKNFDPERQRGTGTDRTTPLYKVISAGINIKF